MVLSAVIVTGIFGGNITGIFGGKYWYFRREISLVFSGGDWDEYRKHKMMPASDSNRQRFLKYKVLILP